MVWSRKTFLVNSSRFLTSLTHSCPCFILRLMNISQDSYFRNQTFSFFISKRTNISVKTESYQAGKNSNKRTTKEEDHHRTTDGQGKGIILILDIKSEKF